MIPEKNQQSPKGVASAVGAFLIWGLSPVYFKLLKAVPPFEILLHRMVWSFVLLVPLILLMGHWNAFKAAFRHRRTMGTLIGTTLLVSVNWFLFIWAINNDQILQTSLGYYINPLISVLLGRIILKERLRRAQGIAVCIAAVGVGYLTLQYGRVPWISLMLAFTFGFYGLIRKTAAVGAPVGLALETLLMTGPAVAYLFYLYLSGGGAFFRMGFPTSFLLMGTALVTAVPLLLFTEGARRIFLSTVGILQYIAPSSTFLLAVFVYGEPFSVAKLYTFILIWTALVLYSTDSVLYYRKYRADLRASLPRAAGVTRTGPDRRPGSGAPRRKAGP